MIFRCFLSITLIAILSAISAKASAQSYQLRVMSYNINGLPWPLAKNKKPLFMEIARIINQKKKTGTAPDIIAIQEGFRPEVKELVAALNYPYVYKGPKDSDHNPLDKSSDDRAQAILGSGLWILSKYPFLKSEKIAFGNWCSGYDCLANKGVAYVQVQVPGIGPVDIFNTHFNSIGSSGTSDEKVFAAQRKQMVAAKYLFDKVSSPQTPLIFAGDFNIKTTTRTYPDLAQSLPLYNAGLFCDAYQYYCSIGENSDPKSLHDSVDQHFYRRSNTFNLNPIYAAKTMRQKLENKALSDHLAFEVIYRFDR